MYIEISNNISLVKLGVFYLLINILQFIRCFFLLLYRIRFYSTKSTIRFNWFRVRLDFVAKNDYLFIGLTD